MANQWNEGYPFHWFVNSPPQNTICGICLDVVNNPHQCCAGHIFCKTCLQQSLKTTKKCPICKVKTTPFTMSKNLFAKETVEELIVVCNDSKCTWKGKLCQQFSHTCCSQDAIIQPSSASTNDEMCPDSSILFPNGSYVGQVDKAGAMHGNGMFCYSAKSGPHYEKVYLGEFRHGHRNGFGVLKTVDDEILFSGNWVLGERHGRGKMWYADGEIFDGEWRVSRHGKGMMTYANGDQFEGMWSNGVRHGNGVHTSANGIETNQIWKRGVLVVTTNHSI
jgi:hypothetical protein